MSSRTPPSAWDDLPLPPDFDFSLPPDPFPAEFFDGTFDYLPEENPFASFTPPQPGMDAAAPTDAAPDYRAEEGWDWRDAGLVAVGRVLEDAETEQYSIGAVDLYENLHTGDRGGRYIAIATFDDIDGAAAYYHELQDDIHARGLLPFQLVDYASERAAERAAARGEPTPEWHSATDLDYAAYDGMRSAAAPDLPPEDRDWETLLAGDTPAPSADEAAAFKALRDIGIAADGFSPDADPPPFVDPDTGTAYWIGIFQPDRDDPDTAIASILSLGRDPETGEMAAQLAPVVPGDWDKAYDAAEYLLGVVERGGIERAFETAEGMALATDQRDLWEAERGLPLEAGAAQELADYTREEWEIDL